MQISNGSYQVELETDDFEISELPSRWPCEALDLAACLTSHSNAPKARELY